jgi:hypothetical protein
MILQYCNIFGWELEVVQWEDLIKLYFYYEVWHIGIYIHKNMYVISNEEELILL